jgi:hypothetical protein
VDFSLGKSRFRIRDYLNDGNILGKTITWGRESVSHAHERVTNETIHDH